MTEPPLEFGAPWGTALKLMSGLFTLLLLGVVWVGVRAPERVGPAWELGLIATPLVLLAAALLHTILGYRLSRDRLLVRRLGWWTPIELQGLEAVAADATAMVGSKRLFANGGLFSFSGRFRSRRLGIYRAFATDPHNSVILRWPRATVVVTPDDPQRFVRAVCELRGIEVQRPE